MSSEGSTAATIIITRNAPDDAQDRWIRIVIDDSPAVEILRYGEVLRREVAPGPHRIKAHNTMTRAVIDVDAGPGEEIRIRCTNTFARVGFLMMLTIGFAVLRVRLEGTLTARMAPAAPAPARLLFFWSRDAVARQSVSAFPPFRGCS